jgi:malonate decarboxylase beta subunit
MMTPRTASSGFLELSPRERLAALFDDGCYVELCGPFDRFYSPWLRQQGAAPQADDGVVVARGRIGAREVAAIAIAGSFEGGSIGEAGGAKIAATLQLAAHSSHADRPMPVVMLLETGGVRLQEATLGLAAIAAIQAAILKLVQLAPVVAVIAGPVGCFGGMSLAAELCTHIIGTPHGRLGMNGPEVIEQEAGPDEIDAGDRQAIWQMIGCAARLRDGWIDEMVQDDAQALRHAVSQAVLQQPRQTTRLLAPLHRLQALREFVHPQAVAHTQQGSQPAHVMSRGRVWLECLTNGNIQQAMGAPSILAGELVPAPGALMDPTPVAIAIVPDAASIMPRAAHGELGLEQGWALAAYIDQVIELDRASTSRRPIVAIVDTPGQAFGRVEEARCISAAAAAPVAAYARARQAGHPVLALVVGRAVSGSFLAHGLHADHIFALAEDAVSMYAMSAKSIARITRRSLAEVQTAASQSLPMSFAIADAHRLGVIDTLIQVKDGGAPDRHDISVVQSHFAQVLASLANGRSTRTSIDGNPLRTTTRDVRTAMQAQWTQAMQAERASALSTDTYSIEA